MISRGQRHYRAKLKSADVRLIRALATERRRLLDEANNITNEKIGEKFGVTGKAIERILYGTNWRHV